MAVTVRWNTDHEETWHEGVGWDEQKFARGPYIIRDADNKIIAEVPDFGVFYLQRTE